MLKAFTFSLGLVLLSNTSWAQDLSQCVNIGDDKARLACFDKLAASISSVESNSEPNNVETAQKKVTELPSSAGGANFEEAAGKTRENYSAQVVKCTQASNGRWFYYFDNKQIWKQVDSRKRRHKQCDFKVTVSKDGFGYYMRIDESNSKIRIRRQR